ncbi:MAG: hypothetical protein PHZ03_04100 [Syntrophomonas sp.]|nr:hypothetical protein [Syntrophomonas sp.]
MILSSWYDRPLSVSGKVALKSSHHFAANEVLVYLSVKGTGLLSHG